MQYTPPHEQLVARKFLMWNEFAKISVSNFAQIPPGSIDLFIQDKSTTIRKLIPLYLLRELQKCYSVGIQSGRIGFKDDQSLRYVAQNDRCGRIMLFNLVDLVRRAIAHNTQPSYCYFGGYINGSFLNPHSDREQCEFSFSITIEQNPPNEAWKLGMNRIPQFEKMIKGEEKISYLGLMKKIKLGWIYMLAMDYYLWVAI